MWGRQEDGEMKNEAAVAVVARALEVLAQLPELPDDPELVVVLERAGLDPADAQRLVALLPLAFGRVALERFGIVGLPRDAWVGHPDGGSSEIRLTDQPLYRPALAAAAAARGTPEFDALAGRSVEVMVLAPAIRAGEGVDVRGLSCPLFYGFEKGVFAAPPWWRRRIGKA